MYNHVADCTVQELGRAQWEQRLSRISSVVFFLYKCAGHFRDGFRFIHQSFRLEFMFAQSFCLQASFNQTDIDGSRPISFRHLEEMLKHCGNCSEAPPSGWSGGRVGRYYLDNKEIRFPLSKLLVPRFLVYQEKLYYCVMSIIHTVTYFSQNPTFVQVEVISGLFLYQNVRNFNQFNSEILKVL